MQSSTYEVCRVLLTFQDESKTIGQRGSSHLLLALSLSDDAALLGGQRQTTALVSSFPRMESPVRSVETGENGGGGGGGGSGGQDSQQSAAGTTGAAGAGAGTQQQSASAGADAFVAKSYLERQVEELSCVDEDEAQEKVSKRLQFKQDQAQKKRWVLCCLFSLKFRERGKRDEAKTHQVKSNIVVAGWCRN